MPISAPSRHGPREGAGVCGRRRAPARIMGHMARLHAQAFVEAVPRDWFEEYVRALLDRAGNLTLDEDGWIEGDEELADVALVEGDHLTVGAKYQQHTDPPEGETGDGTTTELVITSWDRRGEVSAAVTTWHPEGDKTAWTVKLSRPDALRSVVTGGTYSGAKRLQQVSWAARLDCGQWWRQASGGGGQAPATVLLRHAHMQGNLRISPSSAGFGKWRVKVTLVVRGRGWLWPFAALVLLAVRGRLEAKFRETVAEMAENWNADVKELLASDPRAAEFRIPRFGRRQEEVDRWIEEQHG